MSGSAVSCRKQDLSDIGGKPYLRTLICDPLDNASVRAVALAVCPWLTGSAHARAHASHPDVALPVVRVMGGVTNRLMRVGVVFPFGEDCTSYSGGLPPPECRSGAVLVRIYGAEGMVDRDVESPAFEALAEWLGGSPAYFGRFANGRVEEFLDGYRALTLGDVGRPQVAVQVAAQMARLHRFPVPPHLAPYFPPRAALWETLWAWYATASDPNTVAAVMARGDVPASELLLLTAPHRALDMGLVKAAALSLEARAPTGGRLAFCHCDLLPPNLMAKVGADGGLSDVRIIDLEYGCVSFAAFDVANHLMEYCGGTDPAQVAVLGVPEYHRLPTAGQRRAFCGAYLAALGSSRSAEGPRGGGGGEGGGEEGGGGGGEGGGEEGGGEECGGGGGEGGGGGGDAELEALLADVEVFMAVDNLYWGLWAVNQAAGTGCAEFPYLLYAKTRLERGLLDAGFGPPVGGERHPEHMR